LCPLTISDGYYLSRAFGTIKPVEETFQSRGNRSKPIQQSMREKQASRSQQVSLFR